MLKLFDFLQFDVKLWNFSPNKQIQILLFNDKKFYVKYFKQFFVNNHFFQILRRVRES